MDVMKYLLLVAFIAAAMYVVVGASVIIASIVHNRKEPETKALEKDKINEE